MENDWNRKSLADGIQSVIINLGCAFVYAMHCSNRNSKTVYSGILIELYRLFYSRICTFVCNISLHINADATTMLGTDTFRDGEVTFRPGPVTEAAEGGGFCVLDEIDSALDDANANLFAEFLSRFSVQTQFIVITHRKPTMRHADTIFGVTMEERGVTKIVSISFEEAEKHASDNR